MDSTPSTTDHATGPLVITPVRLLAAFATAPDPWRVASIDYPLAAVLGLAVTAPLCAHTSVLAIAEWGKRQRGELLAGPMPRPGAAL